MAVYEELEIWEDWAGSGCGLFYIICQHPRKT